MRPLLRLVTTCLILGFGSTAGSSSDLASIIDVGGFRDAAGSPLLSASAVEQFYREHGNRQVWTEPGDPALADLRTAIEGAADHGLDPRDYHAAALSKPVEEGNGRAVEILATDAYITLGAHLLRGKVDPILLEPNWTATRRSENLIQYLSVALKTGRVRESLESLAPKARAYRALQSALRLYAASAGAGWRAVPDGPTLKAGMRGARVAALRRRLEADRLLEPTSGTPSEVFDEATETAVGLFQKRIGLEADGVVGAVTLRELNRTPEDRAAQIRANLERWRWLAEDLGPRHIRVNIAEFKVETWADGRRVDVYEAIVGRPYRKTPVFSDLMSYVVLNPWWETPRSIARLDKLPDFKADGTLVGKLGFDVLDAKGTPLDGSKINWHAYSAQNFPLRLRQRPGANNALGRVKLMFPNRHNVYLHDTPTQQLFGRTRRDFSSGCIRVQRALDLTGWVLSGTSDWDRTKIDAIVASGRETRINLASKIPVHILYMTVAAAEDGRVHFLSDIYDRDERLIAALGKAPRGRWRRQ